MRLFLPVIYHGGPVITDIGDANTHSHSAKKQGPSTRRDSASMKTPGLTEATYLKQTRFVQSPGRFEYMEHENKNKKWEEALDMTVRGINP